MLRVLETDIQEKEQKESQKQANPSPGRKGPSQVKVLSHPIIPADSSSSIPADYVSAGHVLVSA
ncbi:hypothetical protein Tco_0279700, partial [Tanacetum coccineum]